MQHQPTDSVLPRPGDHALHEPAREAAPTPGALGEYVEHDRLGAAPQLATIGLGSREQPPQLDPCTRHDLVGVVGGADHPCHVLAGPETLVQRPLSRFHQRVVQLVGQLAHVAKHFRPVPRQRRGVGHAGEADREIVTHPRKIVAFLVWTPCGTPWPR